MLRFPVGLLSFSDKEPSRFWWRLHLQRLQPDRKEKLEENDGCFLKLCGKPRGNSWCVVPSTYAAYQVWQASGNWVAHYCLGRMLSDLRKDTAWAPWSHYGSCNFCTACSQMGCCHQLKVSPRKFKQMMPLFGDGGKLISIVTFAEWSFWDAKRLLFYK